MLERNDRFSELRDNGFFAEIRDDWVKHREGQRGSLEALNPPRNPPQPPPWDGVWVRRRRIARASLVSLNAVLFATTLSELFPRSVCALLLVVGAMGFGASYVLLARFTCPRCGRLFDTVRKTRRLRITNAFTSRCLYCGLHIGQRS